MDKEVPRGFKMTELGPLPEEWETVKLEDVAEFGSNQRQRGGNGSLIPFIPMSLLPEEGVYITKWELRQPSEVRSGVHVREGDFLLAKITPCLENGKQGIIRGLPGGWGYATTEVIPIRPSSTLDVRYLALYLKAPNIRQELASKMEGTTGRQRLSKTVVQSLPISLPPLSEQREIASILSTVQRSAEATERVIVAAHDLKRSLMQKLFDEGLDTAVPRKETEIGLIPVHWEVGELGAVGEIITGTTPSTAVSEYYGGPYPFITPADIGEAKYAEITPRHLSEKGLKVARPLPRDTILVVCIGATIGKTAMTLAETSVTNQQINAIIPNQGASPHYLYYATSYFSPRLPSLAGRTAVPIINKSNFAKFPIPIPPLSEQREIASILSTVDHKIEAEEGRQAALRDLFRTLLHELMTGKVRVNSQ